MVEQIGRYEIKRELGRGGMATVYLAFDPRFQRPVAIKVLPRQFTHDPKFLERFEREAQTIAKLEHPAIVPVYDFGEHDDAPFLAMRYMAGGSLRGRMHGEPLSLEVIAPALERLAPALDYAHELGIVHRDLKPANILFDHEERPYLADFGIARLAEASQTMTVAGSPAYMSPEQVESELPLDGRSDVYALGIILYELLSGEQPYVAESPAGQMLMHISKPIPNILEANPDLPAGTQQVIEKAMAKDREERYQSAAELATAVGQLLPSGTAVPAAEAPGEEVVSAHAQADPIAPESVQPGSDSSGEALPRERTMPWPDLPNWAWMAGALVLLVIAALGMRSILAAGIVDVAKPAQGAEATPAVEVAAKEKTSAGADSALLDATLGETWVRPADEMTMAYVPAGPLPMGSEKGEPVEAPLHEVTLDAFWIDRTEVTNEQYMRCVNEGNCDPSFFMDNATFNGDDYPVVGVSWYDAEAYCEWVDTRLPTEAEWEYAARGPEGQKYPWGAEAPVCELAQFGGCDGDTIPAGSLPGGASWAGSLDMAGNAWEWVSDWYSAGYYSDSESQNPQGPDSGISKVVRGGSWGNGALYLRGAPRDSFIPKNKYAYVGFRCAVAPGS